MSFIFWQWIRTILSPNYKEHISTAQIHMYWNIWTSATTRIEIYVYLTIADYRPWRIITVLYLMAMYQHGHTFSLTGPLWGETPGHSHSYRKSTAEMDIWGQKFFSENILINAVYKMSTTFFQASTYEEIQYFADYNSCPQRHLIGIRTRISEGLTSRPRNTLWLE